MVAATKLVYDFTKQLGSAETSFAKSMSVIDKCSYLTDALYIYFENRVSIAETNRLVRNDLRVFEKKNQSLKKIRDLKDQSIFGHPENFYSFLRTDAIAYKEQCDEERLLVGITIQTDDLSNALKDPFWKPSFEWEETLVDESSEGLHVFHNGDFEVREVKADYYEKPKEIHCPSLSANGQYEDWNGKVQKKDSGLEIDSTMASRKIVDIAVLLAHRDNGNVRDFQTQINKILLVEKIHTN